MKKKSVSMLLLVMSIGLLSVMSVASAAEDEIFYTGDAYESKCNVCLEATVLYDGDPNSGVSVRFRIKPVGGSWETFDTETTDDDGIAALCIGEKAPGEYRVRAILLGTTPRVKVTTDLHIYEARATGGGQVRAKPSDILKPKKKDWYKISFGMGVYNLSDDPENGVFSLDSCEVTFHNVSLDAIDNYKFVASGITEMRCTGLDGNKIRLTVTGELLDELGENGVAAQIEMQVQDLGEPSTVDSLRFVLTSATYNYDTSEDKGGDFPEEAQKRAYLVKGNLQVECPVVCPEVE